MKQLILKPVTIRTMIGLLQGIILFGLYHACGWYSPTPDKIFWPATQPYAFMPLLMVSLFVPLLIVQGIGNMRVKILTVWGFFATIILVGISCYAVYRQIWPNQSVEALALLLPPGNLIFLTIIALFIAQSLILSSDHDNQWIAQYTTYFDLAWKMCIQIVCTFLFTGLFWLLLWLGSNLFEVIHLYFFKNIISKPEFAIPATILAITMAIHITDVNARMIRGIRTLILILLSTLLPLITGIVAVFLFSLFFTGLTLLWQTGRAGMLLIFAAMMLIVLINAAYQDGTHEKTKTRIRRYAEAFSCYLLIPITILAIYALSLRVAQYGWSAHRINAATGMLIIASYAIGYTLATSMPNSKVNLIKHWNLATAVLMLVIYLALFSPFVDPARITVHNQLFRLQSGRVDPEKFDFSILRFDGLRFGHQALQNLQDNWSGPKAEYVRAKAKETLKLKDRYSILAKDVSLEEKSKLIVLHSDNEKLPASFLTQKWGTTEGVIGMPFCLSNGIEKCDAWLIKRDGKPTMILILGRNEFTGFQQNEKGIWRAVGNWTIPYPCVEKIRNAAIEGKFKMTSSEHLDQDIEVMGLHMNFNQNYDENICK